ncbi:unnamed protein product, partial [Didymodactylos carnosus]
LSDALSGFDAEHHAREITNGRAPRLSSTSTSSSSSSSDVPTSQKEHFIYKKRNHIYFNTAAGSCSSLDRFGDVGTSEEDDEDEVDVDDNRGALPFVISLA